MLESIVAAVLAFVSTNIDDIFVIMLFFGSKRFNAVQIVAGQYLGIVALVVISFIISLVGHFVEPKYIGLLGLFPIYLAIKQFIDLFRGNAHDEEAKLVENKMGILTVAGVTIANGSDNIGVYVPLLAKFNVIETSVLAVVFTAMTLIWCYLGIFLSTRPLLASAIEKYGHIVMPAVFLLLGVYIIWESGLFTT